MERENYLKQICINKFGARKHSHPSLMNLPPDMLEEIRRVYYELGGLQDDVPYRFRGYDIEVKDFIIELDEQEHFNRFRSMTLDSSIYKNFSNFNVNEYQKFCKTYESECRTYGKFWENSSTKKQFSSAKINDSVGASRWKQRAFYDFIKDAYSVAVQLPIVRISIYEKYDNQSINDLIKNEEKDKLLKYIEQRYSIAKGK